MNFTYTFTEAEANTVVAALAKQPFSEVYLLVAKIQEASKRQLDAENMIHVAGTTAND